MPFDPEARETLLAVTTATITTILLKKGLRNVWMRGTLPLREGENIVGRHPSSGVWIDGTSVSRVHAGILARSGRVVVEDHGSRNGTFVDGKRISGPHVLVDGNTVTFGSENTVFRQWSDEAAAGTEPVRR